MPSPRTCTPGSHRARPRLIGAMRGWVPSSVPPCGGSTLVKPRSARTSSSFRTRTTRQMCSSRPRGTSPASRKKLVPVARRARRLPKRHPLRPAQVHLFRLQLAPHPPQRLPDLLRAKARQSILEPLVVLYVPPRLNPLKLAASARVQSLTQRCRRLPHRQSRTHYGKPSIRRPPLKGPYLSRVRTRPRIPIARTEPVPSPAARTQRLRLLLAERTAHVPPRPAAALHPHVRHRPRGDQPNTASACPCTAPTPCARTSARENRRCVHWGHATINGAGIVAARLLPPPRPGHPGALHSSSPPRSPYSTNPSARFDKQRQRPIGHT